MDAAIRNTAMMREAVEARRGWRARKFGCDSTFADPPQHKRRSRSACTPSTSNCPEKRKSKLTLDAFVPLPADVDNQRYEPLFDKYIITGKTYRTASGAVVPNELQYYNGEMVHIYGECTNISLLNAALAGSGYRPMTVKYADGRIAAVAQLWSNKFTDTSIRPYAAMFIVVAAVRGERTRKRGVYQCGLQWRIERVSDARRIVRPLNSGVREQGADVHVPPPRYDPDCDRCWTRAHGHRQTARDRRHGVQWEPASLYRSKTRTDVALSKQTWRSPKIQRYIGSAVAQAADTAGITLQALPRGAECAYPVVARIGQGQIVCWQWRSDVAPRLQPVMPGTVHFDPSSEEGRTLLAWGFTPKVLGYFPKVRGVVTGLADQTSGDVRASSASRGEANADSRPRSWASGEAVSAQSRWAWETRFLGSLRADLRKELVGAMPDGLRINWHVKEGTFVGPGLDAVVLPGAADWMHIRKDGIAIVNVRACFETRDHVRVYGTYGGIFDLGPDGYARALRDEYDRLPPVVVTPTYETADPRLEWLNRAQCIGVGRVDMTAFRVEFDVYVVRVGERTDQASNSRA